MYSQYIDLIQQTLQQHQIEIKRVSKMLQNNVDQFDLMINDINNVMYTQATIIEVLERKCEDIEKMMANLKSTVQNCEIYYERKKSNRSRSQ